MKPATWEELYSEGQRLRAENDALRLRVAVLEKAVDEASRAKHAANNRCQAAVSLCERAAHAFVSRGWPETARELREEIEATLKASDR